MNRSEASTRPATFSKSSGRYWALRLLAVAVSVLVTLAFAELVLRIASGLLDPQLRQAIRATPEQAGVAHPYIGHLHRPNRTLLLAGKDFNAVHHVDALGFRNRWPWPREAEIVAVGDSLTFGYGVDDNHAWPFLLAQSLSGLRVINLGLIGAGPQQYLRLYETFGVALRPKLVIVGVFARNDFWDADLFDRWLASGVGGNYMVWRDFGRPVRVGFGASPSPVRRMFSAIRSLAHPLEWLESVLRSDAYPLMRRSYLYNLARAARSSDTPVASVTFTFSNGRQLRLLPDDLTSKTAGSKAGDREFGLVVDALTRLDMLGRQNGTHVLMVFQPSKDEVYLPLLGRAVPDATEELRRAFDRQGIEYLDLLPVFRRHAEAGEQLFFEVDGHPNETGYGLIAQAVQSHVREHLKGYGLSRGSSE